MRLVGSFCAEDGAVCDWLDLFGAEDGVVCDWLDLSGTQDADGAVCDWLDLFGAIWCRVGDQNFRTNVVVLVTTVATSVAFRLVTFHH